ncbi:MAG: dihydropteroate synthase [Gammaproteobacteria bacterium]|nr:dihydropteroate synthase [Gammaproteobacteria bacterium]
MSVVAALKALLQGDAAIVMGIVNATPDSFSDGGQHAGNEAALEHGLKLLAEGADILDIGGESTRPGAEPVSIDEELDRVIPVIEGLRAHSDCVVSIDTTKPEVMLAAADAGASLINDVNALRAEGALQVASETGLAVCLMHMQGQPQTMQEAPEYKNVVDEVAAFLSARVDICEHSGVARELLIADPGIGFGKSLEHNLALLAAVPKLQEAVGCPLLIGASRKSMIDAILDRAVDERMPASVGLAVQAVLNGAKIVRVHDVQATVDAVRIVERVCRVHHVN